MKNIGDKVYIATTVGEEYVLGTEVALQANEPALTEAYGRYLRGAPL